MKYLITKTLTFLFITALFTSCGVDMFNSVNGNRNVVTKNRKTNNDFTGIKVSTGIDVYLTQGNKNKITVEADENLHDIIITEVKDDVLRIYSEQSIWRAKARKVHVIIKDLKMLRATSGSDVYTENTITTDEISIAATSGADIKISVNANSVETSTTSGSDIKIAGKAINHASTATSGSSIDAYYLESENAIAKATSGANINIYASQRLEAKATSGGDIDFKGNPKQVTKKSSSGGSVSKK
ncbi:head GIN domain-containing protein [Polaribacter sp. WD7]|uniref:head GIN domain-containing protein n=1 Tax=Polaribacter sp. WD7 TaxID=2269061 RepID=UPI002161B52C|nr:head GIN domain-containing protein [Polaribacter sp. WD7]